MATLKTAEYEAYAGNLFAVGVSRQESE